MDYTEAAQDALEASDAWGEQRQEEARYRAELGQETMTATAMLDELAECSDELMIALAQFDRGELELSRLGLLLVNVRNASAQTAAGVAGAPDAPQAAAFAFLGVSV